MGEADSAEGLLVADSFRVRRLSTTGAAEVRGLGRHLRRFRRSVLACISWPAGQGSRRIDLFLERALAQVAEYGSGFPRLELRPSAEANGEPALDVSLRPLPRLRETIALRSVSGVHLIHPERKGPNIARLAELNRACGAEALLLDEDGRAVEGATTSLIWWQGGGDDPGRYVAEHGNHGNRVHSVTETLLREAARHQPPRGRAFSPRPGVLSQARPTLDELADSEVWAVNALHGIRVVTHLDDVALPAPRMSRLNWFREALDRTWEPVLHPE